MFAHTESVDVLSFDGTSVKKIMAENYCDYKILLADCCLFFASFRRVLKHVAGKQIARSKKPEVKKYRYGSAKSKI